MTGTIQKIYNKTPWQQKRLSQPLTDPNYQPNSPPRQSSFRGGNPTDDVDPSLRRQVSIAGHGADPSHSTTDAQPLRRGMTRADTKISLRKSKKDSRRVFVNIPPPPQFLDNKGQPKFTYGSNRINTAKYTVLTFLPKNLFEQFRRVANMFFLFMAIIQLTPLFTVGSPFLTVFPLCFVVGVTAIKDGFEDYKRHVEDRNFNQRLCLQLKNVVNYNYTAASPEQSTDPENTTGPQPDFVKEQWHNLRVGDFIMLKNNQAVPADAIILATSEPEGSCFIETKDLDGETNLKARVSLQETSKYNTARRCSRLKCYIDMEPINANLFTFNGSLTMLARKRHLTGDAAARAGRAGANRFSVYAPSITSSMMSSVRGSMDEPDVARGSFEEHRRDLSGDVIIEEDFDAMNGAGEHNRPAQGGTSASDYAQMHMSSKRRPAVEGAFPGDKQEYVDSDENEESSPYRSHSRRSGLHRTATASTVGRASEMAKNVLKNNYEQQFQSQHPPRGGSMGLQHRMSLGRNNSRALSRRESHGAGPMYKETTIPVDINNMLLRGHVAINFIILLMLCIVCAVGSTIYDRKWRGTGAEQLWDMTTRGVVTEGVVTFFQSLIIFQNIIPISLYISIEFVKTFQAYFIWQDSDMYDIELDQFCTPKTWNLTDDLGQIEYVFSDKTGTLTRNIMEFKKCSINGKVYGNNAISGQTDAEKGLAMLNQGSDQEAPLLPNNEVDDRNKARQEKEALLKEYDEHVRKIFDPTYMDPLDKITFADVGLFKDLFGQSSSAGAAVSDGGSSSSSANPRQGGFKRSQPLTHDGSPSSNVYDFFTLLSLCHTVVVEQPEEQVNDDDDDEFGMFEDSPDGKKSSPNGSNIEGNAENAGEGSSGPLSFGFRDKLKQKAGAVGLVAPNAGSSSNGGKAGGNRSRKNSNAASTASKQLLNGSDIEGASVLNYRAESPDEAALVSAAKNVGFAFVSRGAAGAGTSGENENSKSKDAKGNSRQNVNINVLGQDYTYEQLDVIKFNSTRKRQTVIVREPQELGGRILLMTKGADNVIFERLRSNPTEQEQDLRDQTENDIEGFSNMGLRTLTLAQRVLDQATYDAWAAKYAEASKALDERAKRMDQVAEEIEKDLTLLGATAIEDKLQEGVPDSIAALREAGIKVWVLTGDKLETAINIGFASRLLEKDMKLEIVKMGRNEAPDAVLSRFKELVNSVLAETSKTGHGKQVVHSNYPGEKTSLHSSMGIGPSHPISPPTSGPIRGSGSTWEEKSLPAVPSNTSLLHNPGAHELQEEDDHDRQHALIVDGSALKVLLDDPEARQDLIKLSDVCFSVICCRASPLQKALVVELIRRGKKTVCLAIGDGANDVSMIQAANIGVGIAGQEGMQAAMASDYSITQFRFIRKLVLVHGHWGYMRIAEMILNFFFKNVVWVGSVLWFQIYCGFSAMLFYDYTFVSLYNLMFTAGATDQDLTAPYVLRYPGVYRLGIHQKRYNQYRFVAYMLDGVWQSLIVFWFWRGVYDTSVLSSSGIDASELEFSTSVAITNVVIASLYIGLHAYHWTWLMHFAVWGSIIFLTLLILIYGAIQSSPIYHVALQLFSQGSFWFMLVLSVVSAMLLKFTILFVSFWWFPDDVHIVRGIMLSEKWEALKRKVRWTGLAPDGMTPQEQSEQEKALLLKEDLKKEAKEKEKAEAAALKAKVKDAKKNRHHDSSNDEQPYDMTMIQINVNDDSPAQSYGRGATGSPGQYNQQHQQQQPPPLEIQRQLMEQQRQQQTRLQTESAAQSLTPMSPSDPAFQHRYPGGVRQGASTQPNVGPRGQGDKEELPDDYE
ncbi:hypothetical protein BGW38_006772 [Lunasporangiospora selenospora]|uniref:P-type phospholipid transporter n=1 Tax=Lunasporangiospora selenospora TaxID=979761 RepID=A0A9P6FZM0_9FUNG|nr:hypothetical protein BGW38_006772 [Lunasporangiospora selenospora]